MSLVVPQEELASLGRRGSDDEQVLKSQGLLGTETGRVRAGVKAPTTARDPR
jgi:hypothetical protein